MMNNNNINNSNNETNNYDEEAQQDDESFLRNWYPRDIASRTNWLYRIDALRMHDIREMHIIWDLMNLYKHYATQFLIWATVVSSVLHSTTNYLLREQLQRKFHYNRKSIGAFTVIMTRLLHKC